MVQNKIRRSVVGMAVLVAMSGLYCADGFTHTLSSNKDDYYERQATKLVGKMTLSEKLDVICGPGYNAASSAINLSSDVDGVAGYINGVSSDKLNIPASKLADGPAGLRISSTRDGDSGTYYATAWPVGTLLASTWNPELVQAVGKAVGNEVKEYGVDFWLAPGMNIQRNPLNGRNFEYYSEDPLLAGEIAASMVNGVQTQGVGTTIKHFFANNSETNRMGLDDIGEPRTFREIYLRSFQIALDNSAPWALMSSYNKVNGTYVNERSDAMTSILRNEWHFNGLTMSDWYAGTPSTTPYKQIAAGGSLIQPGGVKTLLASEVESGDLSEASVTQSAIDVMTQVLKTPSYNHYSYSNSPDLTAHVLLARAAGDEGMILLRNNTTTLPISSSAGTVALFGLDQVNTYKGGTGSGDVNINSSSMVNIQSGMAAQFTLDDTLKTYYTDLYNNGTQCTAQSSMGVSTYYTCDEPAIDSTLQANIASAATSDQIAVVTIGRISGEGVDRTNVAGDYQLSTNELALLKAVHTAFNAQGKKVVVVLNVSGVIDTASWSDYADAILLAYQGGQQTGNEVADILSGAVNPSGKLAQTFPASYSDVPSANTFPGIDTDADGTVDTLYYNEGIYVGYRYYWTVGKDVSYPFGYGLSYTTFNYGNPSVASNTLNSKDSSGSVTLKATVSNTGSVAGKAVAQVYVTAPEVKLKKPLLELKAFAKTRTLAPGASQRLTFTIPAKYLASFDPKNNEWIVEPGTYKVYVSSSSDVSDVTPVSFNVKREVVVSYTTKGALALPDANATFTSDSISRTNN